MAAGLGHHGHTRCDRQRLVGGLAQLFAEGDQSAIGLAQNGGMGQGKGLDDPHIGIHAAAAIFPITVDHGRVEGGDPRRYGWDSWKAA